MKKVKVKEHVRRPPKSLPPRDKKGKFNAPKKKRSRKKSQQTTLFGG